MDDTGPAAVEDGARARARARVIHRLATGACARGHITRVCLARLAALAWPDAAEEETQWD